MPVDIDPLPFGTQLRARRTARCVRAGGVVAYPTEAVYGIGCLPEDQGAVARVLRIKRRSWRKGLLLIGADLEQLERYADFEASPLLDRILAGWPGPYTWVLPARKHAPAWVTGGRRTIAVRWTAHPLARFLCYNAGGALISTSANLSRRPPLTTALGVRRALGAELDDVLPGPLGGQKTPTEIRDGMTGRALRL